MRVAKVDGLVTLFYDGSKKPFNRQLQVEWRKKYIDHDEEIKGWEEWNLSNECREYIRERLSWQQVIVVEGVTVIPRETFKHCFNVKKVIFANTVVRIEYCAFIFCKSLVYIELSINLEYIGSCTFASCNLSSVFLPPRCRQIGYAAFDYNKNLTICHVPRDTELEDIVFAQTKLIANSPFGDEEGQYDHAREEVHNWIKNVNNDEEYALHRACCYFQPSKQLIFTIIEEKGIGAFKVKNEAGITPSQYLKENPYADIDEMDIIREYVSKMMGEIGKI